MTSDKFNRHMEERLRLIRSVMQSKTAEYGNDDALHGFHRSAAIAGHSREIVAVDQMTKHLVNVIDYCNGDFPFTETLVREKCGDAINFLIMIEMMLLEHLEETSQYNTIQLTRQGHVQGVQ